MHRARGAWWRGSVAVIVVLASFAAPAVLAAQQCRFCGDVNGDGVVDIVDALFIAQHTVGLRPNLP